MLSTSDRNIHLSFFTVENTSDAIFWMCPKGYIKHANKAACDRLGYDYEEFTEMHISDISKNFTQKSLQETWERIKNGEEKLLEAVHYHKNGKGIPVEINVNFVAFEGMTYTCSIVRDISVRKRKEAALRGALMEIKALKEKLEAENNYLQEEIKLQNDFGDIVYQSEGFANILKKIQQVAPTRSTVLITGESGTGKELLARAIHDLSDRRERPLIKVNCAALPANLIESELFGHEKGAFTGATTRRMGRFELANGGTLFLDEIGELPMDLQPKLLRVIQEGEFERLGGTETIKVEVRLVAATNRNLLQEIKKNAFREDLYYRLNVFPIHALPLRERKEDIPLLVRHFCNKLAPEMGVRITNIPQRELQRLQKYSFPGNIRELENIVERAMITAENGKLLIGNWLPQDKGIPSAKKTLTLAELQKKHIEKVLKMTKGRVSGAKGAAKILGIKPTTLESRMKKLGVKKNR